MFGAELVSKVNPESISEPKSNIIHPKIGCKRHQENDRVWDRFFRLTLFPNSFVLFPNSFTLFPNSFGVIPELVWPYSRTRFPYSRTRLVLFLNPNSFGLISELVDLNSSRGQMSSGIRQTSSGNFGRNVSRKNRSKNRSFSWCLLKSIFG